MGIGILLGYMLSHQAPACDPYQAIHPFNFNKISPQSVGESRSPTISLFQLNQISYQSGLPSTILDELQECWPSQDAGIKHYAQTAAEKKRYDTAEFLHLFRKPDLLLNALSIHPNLFQMTKHTEFPENVTELSLLIKAPKDKKYIPFETHVGDVFQNLTFLTIELHQDDLEKAQSLGGFLFSGLSSCAGLKQLRLNLPMQSLEGMEKLKDLHTLEFQACDNLDLTPLKELRPKTLKIVGQFCHPDLSFRFWEQLKVLKNIISLKRLTIQNCFLTEETLSWINDLENLEYLYLENNEIENLGFLTEKFQNQLDSLDLNGNPVMNDLPDWYTEKWSDKDDVSEQSFSFYEEAVPEPSEQEQIWNALKNLDLHEDAKLAFKCDPLTEALLRNPKLIKSISNPNDISFIDLLISNPSGSNLNSSYRPSKDPNSESTRVQDAEMNLHGAYFVRLFPQLEKLTLRIKMDIPLNFKFIKRLKKLKGLHIEGQLNDTLQEPLEKRALKSLTLDQGEAFHDHNPHMDWSCIEKSYLTMTHLTLRHCQLQDSDIKNMCLMQKLDFVNLEHNNLTDVENVVDNLKLLCLDELSLGGNPVARYENELYQSIPEGNSNIKINLKPQEDKSLEEIKDLKKRAKQSKKGNKRHKSAHNDDSSMPSELIDLTNLETSKESEG
jgi:hypothetical protein